MQKTKEVWNLCCCFREVSKWEYAVVVFTGANHKTVVINRVILAKVCKCQQIHFSKKRLIIKQTSVTHSEYRYVLLLLSHTALF